MGAAGFAALRLRTGSLWPGIALHAAYDLTFRLVVIQPGTAFAGAVYTLHGLGWLLFAVLVLRSHPRARRRRSDTRARVSARARQHRTLLHGHDKRFRRAQRGRAPAAQRVDDGQALGPVEIGPPEPPLAERSQCEQPRPFDAG